MATTLNGVNIIAEHLEDVHMHTTVLFPESTADLCVITAHADGDTWSAWVEVADDQPVTLSSKFTSYAGHICAMVVEETNQASTLYMAELAYGASKVIVCRFRFLSESNQIGVAQVKEIPGAEIPAGETVYYRCMCATAGSKTANIYLRYFLDP